jgi:DNA polymerase III subunit beta
MQIKITKTEFLKGLYLAQSIADRKATMPVLANVLIRSEGKESILCAATDLKVSVVAEIRAEVVEEGGMSLGAKHLFEIVKGLPEGEVALKRTENNWAEIRGGKAQYRLVGMSDRDFPRLPEQRAVDFKEVDAATLGDMIDKTIFSVSSDETRRHLSGIYVEWVKGVLRMVSTDGHRLSKVESEVGEGLQLETGVIVPRKAVVEIRRLLEGVEGMCDLGTHEGHLFVRAKDLCLSAKLVDAQFPPYQQVVPGENEKKVVVGRVALLDCLRRVSIMASERNGGIRLDLEDDVLRITSENADLGEAQEDLDVEYKGEKLTIGFNARYFMDILNEMESEKVMMEFSGELDPGMIHPAEGKSYLGVVMPMRL